MIIVPKSMFNVFIFEQIFLHNKYHQVWVYLHFPLHLCQVAFGISLIDMYVPDLFHFEYFN